MIKPWHVALGVPVGSFLSWLLMLSQIPTWDAFRPLHMAISIGCLVAFLVTPFLIVAGTKGKNTW